jgi:RNA polymerase sigma-B factor
MTLMTTSLARSARIDEDLTKIEVETAAPSSPAEAAPVKAPSRAAKEADAAAKALIAALADLPADSPDRPRVRQRLIEAYLPLAEHLARRFRNRGEPLDDLVQVACLALVKSVDGYDHSRGAAFTSYAIPMILGELKRHFRDKGWNVRVPRRLQELRLDIGKSSGDLAQRLGHSPTVAELAEHLGVGEDDIIEAMESGHAYRALSLTRRWPATSRAPSWRTCSVTSTPTWRTWRTARRCGRCSRSCRSVSSGSSSCGSSAT